MRVTIDTATALLLMALAGVGCSAASKQDNGASTGGASASTGGARPAVDSSQPKDIKTCDSPPEVGASCVTYGDKCQVAQAPCGSIFTCDGVWTEVKNCGSSPSDCPTSSLESGVPCTKAGLTCSYIEACGEIDTECTDGVWHATPVPLPECESLCQAMCTRLTACNVSWAPLCLAECRAVHTCPAPSKQDTVALCQARATAIAPLDCNALCANATLGSPALGEDDCGM